MLFFFIQRFFFFKKYDLQMLFIHVTMNSLYIFANIFSRGVILLLMHCVVWKCVFFVELLPEANTKVCPHGLPFLWDYCTY